MRSYDFNKCRCVFATSALSVIFALCVASADGQNAGSAAQGSANEGGESASDDPADTGDPEVTFAPQEDEETSQTLSPGEQAEALDQRGGEQSASGPRGQSLILGMKVQESDSGRARVVDVGAASPAFDAGIREGDEIVSFDGFHGKSYREWIDGIRRLVNDTPDGETVAVVVLRDGEEVSANIQTPEANALDPRLPGVLGQQLAAQRAEGQANMPATGGQPGFPGIISDDDVFINGSGLFGEEASQVSADRAVAQIFRLDASQPATPAGALPDTGTQVNGQISNRQLPQAQAGAAAATATGAAAATGPTAATRNQVQPGGQATAAAGRIGLAGFHDSQDGMVVMLDVGNLPPGSYRVSIEDPSIAMRQSSMRSALNDSNVGARGTQRDIRRNEIDQENAVGDETVIDPRRNNQPPGNRRIIPHAPGNQRTPATNRGQQSPGTPGSVDQRQGSVEPAGQLIPPTVLAQVVDEGTGQPSSSATPPTGQVLPPATPPTGRVLPPGAPATGRVLPSGTTPTGQPDPEGAAVTPTTQQGIGENSGNALATQALSQFGMLTIDQSGTGRMQHVVEGIRVRDVVGQAIVLHASANQPTTAVPPNANTSGTAVRDQASATQGSAPRNNSQAPQNAANQQGATTRNQAPAGATAGAIAGTGLPVAAGIIQMMGPRGGGQGADVTSPAGNAARTTVDPVEAGTPANEPTQRLQRRQNARDGRQRNITPQSNR